jgi:hypothetical protein
MFMKKFIKSLILTIGFVVAVLNANAATLTVTSNADSGPGTLRQIIANGSAYDVIIFAPDVNYITLTSGDIKIEAYSQKILTIDGESRVTISGNNNSGIFNLYGSILLELNNLTLENASDSGAIQCDYLVNLYAKNCIFRNNESNYGGGAVSME